MSRSVKKGPFIQPVLLKRVEEMNAAGEKKVLGIVGLVLSILGTVYSAFDFFFVGICATCTVCALAAAMG